MGLFQAELAAALGVSQSTVGMWEKNKNKPEFDTLLRIAEFFNVTVAYLIGETDSRATAVDPDDKTPTLQVYARDGSPEVFRLTPELAEAMRNIAIASNQEKEGNE